MWTIFLGPLIAILLFLCMGSISVVNKDTNTRGGPNNNTLCIPWHQQLGQPDSKYAQQTTYFCTSKMKVSHPNPPDPEHNRSTVLLSGRQNLRWGGETVLKFSRGWTLDLLHLHTCSSWFPPTQKNLDIRRLFMSPTPGITRAPHAEKVTRRSDTENCQNNHGFLLRGILVLLTRLGNTIMRVDTIKP